MKTSMDSSRFQREKYLKKEIEGSGGVEEAKQNGK